MIPEFQTKQLNGSVIVQATENQLVRFRRQFKEQFKIDILDCVNIEFVENNTKYLLEENFALSYLKNCIDIPPVKIEDKSQYPELHSELCGKEYTIPSLDQFDKLSMQLNTLQAAFLIEVFCPNQSPEEKGSINKRFLKEKTVYTLLLIAPLPVSFELDKSNPQLCILNFANIENFADAALIQGQVKFALGAFLIQSCSACFSSVDCERFTLKSAQELSNSLDCAVLRTPNFTYYEGNGFNLYILPNAFGQEIRDQIKLKVEHIYSDVQLFRCENCDKFVSQNSQEECSTISLIDKHEDMVFDNHKLTGISTSQFHFGTFKLL